jgi:hypothetical protein
LDGHRGVPAQTRNQTKADRIKGINPISESQPSATASLVLQIRSSKTFQPRITQSGAAATEVFKPRMTLMARMGESLERRRETASRFDHSLSRRSLGVGGSHSVIRSLFRISDLAIRICRSVLLLALLLAALQFAAAAHVQTAMILPDVVASSSIDVIACITSLSEEKQPSQDDNNFPDSTTDLDDTDGGLDDLNPGADTSTRNYEDTPLLSVTGFDAVTLRTPRIVPILLFPVRCFYCLHQHIRERAPPILV